MKIIVTGASGFVGMQLIPSLLASGHSLLLLGRDPAKLNAQFPDVLAESYSGVSADQVSGFDCCIHMATRNNDQPGSAEDFHQDNVERLGELVRLQISARVKRHIYVSSILAKEDSPSPYGQSKWQAEQSLLQLVDQHPDIKLSIVRPAMIYSGAFRGTLAVLNKLPKSLRALAFHALSALRPALDYERFETSIHALLNAAPLGDPDINTLTNRQIGNPAFALARWMLDMLFVLAIVVVFGWLFPVLMLLIRLESAGPSFFVQPRVGKDGKVFHCCKFRTMKQDTESLATHQVSKASVTRMGNFLRKYKIDELPQVWNIMRREMSLIGPRPCLTVQKELIDWRQKLGVLDILPGITGFAQVNNIDMSDPEKLAHVDADYIAKRTLVLDAMIVIRTFLGGGMKDYVAK